MFDLISVPAVAYWGILAVIFTGAYGMGWAKGKKR